MRPYGFKADQPPLFTSGEAYWFASVTSPPRVYIFEQRNAIDITIMMTLDVSSTATTHIENRSLVVRITEHLEAP